MSKLIIYGYNKLMYCIKNYILIKFSKLKEVSK